MHWLLFAGQSCILIAVVQAFLSLMVISNICSWVYGFSYALTSWVQIFLSRTIKQLSPVHEILMFTFPISFAIAIFICAFSVLSIPIDSSTPTIVLVLLTIALVLYPLRVSCILPSACSIILSLSAVFRCDPYSVRWFQKSWRLLPIALKLPSSTGPSAFLNPTSILNGFFRTFSARHFIAVIRGDLNVFTSKIIAAPLVSTHSQSSMVICVSCCIFSKNLLAGVGVGALACSVLICWIKLGTDFAET